MIRFQPLWLWVSLAALLGTYSAAAQDVDALPLGSLGNDQELSPAVRNMMPDFQNRFKSPFFTQLSQSLSGYHQDSFKIASYQNLFQLQEMIQSGNAFTAIPGSAKTTLNNSNPPPSGYQLIKNQRDLEKEISPEDRINDLLFPETGAKYKNSLYSGTPFLVQKMEMNQDSLFQSPLTDSLYMPMDSAFAYPGQPSMDTTLNWTY